MALFAGLHSGPARPLGRANVVATRLGINSSEANAVGFRLLNYDSMRLPCWWWPSKSLTPDSVPFCRAPRTGGRVGICNRPKQVNK